MMDYLYVIGLLLIAGFAIAGLYSEKFKDNLLQCIGLSVVAASCILLVWSILMDSQSDNMKLRILIEVGILSYAFGTFRKIIKH